MYKFPEVYLRYAEDIPTLRQINTWRMQRQQGLEHLRKCLNFDFPPILCSLILNYEDDILSFLDDCEFVITKITFPPAFLMTWCRWFFNAPFQGQVLFLPAFVQLIRLHFSDLQCDHTQMAKHHFDWAPAYLNDSVPFISYDLTLHLPRGRFTIITSIEPSGKKGHMIVPDEGRYLVHRPKNVDRTIISMTGDPFIGIEDRIPDEGRYLVAPKNEDLKLTVSSMTGDPFIGIEDQTFTLRDLLSFIQNQLKDDKIITLVEEEA